MARLNIVTPARAAGRTKELYDAILGAIGMAPKLCQTRPEFAPAPTL